MLSESSILPSSYRVLPFDRLLKRRSHTAEHKSVSFEVYSKLARIQSIERDSLLQFLYGNLSDKQQATILPLGCTYAPVPSHPETFDHKMNIGYFGPHPSDLPDFLGGTVALLRKSGHKVYELLLTEGEKGVDRMPEDVTRNIRRQETKKSAEYQGVTVQYMRAPEGNMLPDGDLLSYLSPITYMIKGRILSLNLGIIFAPAPELDHPDHVAVYLATIHALTQLAREGYFRKRSLPALYITDPEFGFASANNWGLEKAEKIFPGKYSRRDRKEKLALRYLLMDISSEIGEATEALYMHKTQMIQRNGLPKEYAAKIPALKRLLGMEINKGWAERIRQVIIPEVTTGGNILSFSVPSGIMYQAQ